MNDRHFSVCGITEIGGRVLLVRHTYGAAENRILLPGGYVKEGELPAAAAEREIFEETSVVCRVRSLAAAEFRPERWCAVFIMDYISGQPKSDNYENSEVLLLSARDAVQRTDITNMSRAILSSYAENSFPSLSLNEYVPVSAERNGYALFGF